MIGMIVWIPAEQRKLGVTERRVMHMSFLCVQIPRGSRTPEWMLRRRIRWAAAKLHRLGIKQVVLPEDFPWLDLLEKKGLRTVETTGLRRRLAVEWTRAALEARGMPGTQVAVSAQKMTPEVVCTVTELALRHRYVLADLPRGGEELCRRLRREYGVSVQLGPDREQLERAEALVLFDPREDLQPQGAVVLELYREDVPLPELELPPALEDQLPAGVSRGTLLAALEEGGVLRYGQITVKAPSCLTF